MSFIIICYHIYLQFGGVCLLSLKENNFQQLKKVLRELCNFFLNLPKKYTFTFIPVKKSIENKFQLFWLKFFSSLPLSLAQTAETGRPNK